LTTPERHDTQYPVHLAAEGGSLELLQWLVDGLGCPLYDEDDQPIRTQPQGDSVLGVASRHRHAHVMRWLVAGKECKVAEIADKAQLVAAVEFLLLGDDGMRGGMRGGMGMGMEEEVKQHEVSDYGSGGEEDEEDDEEEEEFAQRLRQGHGLSTRRATATAAGSVKEGGGRGGSGGSGSSNSGRRRSEKKGARQPPDGARCVVVDRCLLCGVSPCLSWPWVVK
jgi:hypothetical protein